VTRGLLSSCMMLDAVLVFFQAAPWVRRGFGTSHWMTRHSSVEKRLQLAQG
jgi:hypothetical protein